MKVESLSFRDRSDILSEKEIQGELRMNIMQVSKMKQDLTPEQQQEFGAVMERFYASPPTDLKIMGDYVTVDQSRSFTLLEVSSIERLSEINDGVWKNILTSVRPKNASTEALLRAAKPIDFNGNTLKLGVFYRFHKERLEEHQHKITVETTIEEIVGTPVRIVCVLTEPPAKPELKEVVKDSEKGRESFDQLRVGTKETNADSSLTGGGDDDIVKIAKEIFS